MKKLFLLAVVGVAVVAFVGVDVVKGALHRARDDIRTALTTNVPLPQQLAEAQALVDAYAESVIKGEVAAENLGETIATTEHEVRTLTARVDREREALVMLRRDLETVPASTAPQGDESRSIRRAWAFKAQSELLERRKADLERLREEHTATLASLAEARAEQQRLSLEVQVLAAEIESLEARTAAARTRDAVGDAGVARSGFADAQARLQEIRTTVREKNRLLEYYEIERRPVRGDALLPEAVGPVDVREALDTALATPGAS